MKLTYNPAFFDAQNIEQAMKIVLTRENQTTEHRWQSETPYLADLIGQSISITAETVLLDYGCGIGRMAKELIARHQCRVVGVDISPNMRAMAVTYVKSDRFLTCPPLMLEVLIERGLRFDAATSIWVLQHCFRPADDIERLQRALKPDGAIFVANNIARVVPTVEKGWVNDGLDIRQMLNAAFALQREGKFPSDKIDEWVAKSTFWAAFVNRRPSAAVAPADALYDRGDTLAQQQRFEEALASYDQALAIKPDHLAALNNRGLALHRLKRFEEALKSYDQALAIRPDLVEAHYNRGDTLQGLERYEQALASYDNALAIKPDYIAALNNRGWMLQTLKRYEEALASYERALAIKPDHLTSLTNRNVVLQELERRSAPAPNGKEQAAAPDHARTSADEGQMPEEPKRAPRPARKGKAKKSKAPARRK